MVLCKIRYKLWRSVKEEGCCKAVVNSCKAVVGELRKVNREKLTEKSQHVNVELNLALLKYP